VHQVGNYCIVKRKTFGDEDVQRSCPQKLLLQDLLKYCPFIHNYASHAVSFCEIFHIKFVIHFYISHIYDPIGHVTFCLFMITEQYYILNTV